MTCAYYEKALDFAGSNQDNFIAVRYEDMSLEPQKTARKIYELIGEPLPASLESWINASNASSDPGASPARPRRNPYSTQRNSTYTATKWRSENSFAAVDYVQVLSIFLKWCVGLIIISENLPVNDAEGWLQFCPQWTAAHRQNFSPFCQISSRLK